MMNFVLQMMVADGVELGHVGDMEGSPADRFKPMITLLAPRPSHKWYFYPQLKADEALIFSQIDSRPDRRCDFSLCFIVFHCFSLLFTAVFTDFHCFSLPAPTPSTPR